jgi:protein gp37
MADRSKIEWTDASWTPIRARNRSTGKIGWHCEHVTTGCEHCYAERMNKRLGTGLAFKPGLWSQLSIFLDEEILTAPLRWRKPRMIFVCSMSDLFAEFVKDEWIDRVFAVMALAPQHTFQVLTKRPARMRAYLVDPLRHNSIELAAEKVTRGPEHFGGKHVLPRLPLTNVWLGVSCERQQEADARIPLLLQTLAAVRFVSAEPLLGPVNLKRIKVADLGWQDVLQGWRDCKDYPGRETVLDWVIVGGESGPNARPMHPDWARALRDQCAAARVPFFFKQWGQYIPGGQVVIASGRKYIIDDETKFLALGKKAAGRRLDGVEHNGMPGPHRHEAAA